MNYDEMVIVKFLSGSPETFFSRKEIARHAVKRDVYEQNTRWADAPLNSLVGQGFVELNKRGCYRIKEGVVI